MWFDTEVVFLTYGVATGGTLLNAFDNAMRAARIADFNIIRVTSIVPPNVPTVKLDTTGQVIKGRGLMLPAVYDHVESSTPGATISAGVAVGVPEQNDTNSGVIFTFSGHCSGSVVEATLREMIEEGMREMRLIDRYEFKCAIASGTVVDRPTCVFAAAPFCDIELVKLFEE